MMDSDKILKDLSHDALVAEAWKSLLRDAPMPRGAPTIAFEAVFKAGAFYMFNAMVAITQAIPDRAAKAAAMQAIEREFRAHVDKETRL